MRKTLFLLSCCLLSPLWAVPVHILVTADMHGCVLPRLQNGYYYGGAAEMLAYWKKNEGYRPDQFLTIACGDIATSGALISSILKGEPTIDVMNRMGYDVCALGNHEFEMGVSTLEAWQKQAKFPFISANLSLEGKAWDVVPPYVILEQNGIKIGIIGLTTTEVKEGPGQPGAGPFADALRKYVPEMRAKGVQFIIVAAHEGAAEIAKVAEQVPELHIPLWLAGHWHELGELMTQDGWIVSSGEYFGSSVRIDMDVDPAKGTGELLSYRQIALREAAPKPDKELAAVINNWKARAMKSDWFTPPTVTIPRLAKAPVIDGKLAADEWQEAADITTFWVPAQSGKAAEPPTEVRLGIDDKNLYLAARCTLVPGFEPTTKSTARDTDQWQDDSIELFIWPNESKNSFVQFIVNASGSLFDLVNTFDMASRVQSDASWNPNYTVKTGRETDAWTLEMAIPLDVARLSAKAGTTFRLNVTRDISNNLYPYATWSPLPVGAFQTAPFFGKAVIGNR